MLAAVSFAACHTRRTTVFGHLNGGLDAERVESRELAVAPGDRIQLSTPHGSITVRAEPGAAARLTATMRASGRTKEEAEQVLARYAIDVDEDRGTTRVRFRGDPTRVRDDDARLVLGAVVDYEVTLPENVAVHAETSSGDIRVAGPVGSCRLDTDYGSIAAEGARGDVSARSGSGDLSVRDVAGERVVADSGHGVVRLENCEAAAVRAASKSGDVVLVNARAATIELDTDYGGVSVRGAAGTLRASSRSGDVDLADVEGGVTARTMYGRVAVDGVLSTLEARSSSGNVSVRAKTGSSDDSDWELASGYGEVTLHVPADFACELAATTRYGEVDCAFPISLDTGKRRDGALKGVIGRGGRTVTMTSGSGNLAVKQL